MKMNLHTHTLRCGHASGKEEEYILRAIENGIEVMGFSDHAPYIFPDGYSSDYRIPVNTAQDYFDTLNALRKKYKDKITIYIGFEMEYYPMYFDDMYKTVKSLGAEYLILGQHFIGNEHPNGRGVALIENTAETLAEYTDCVISGIKTGAFTYVCHPDLSKSFGDTDLYKAQARRLCETAKQYEIPLEINLLGIRDNRHYPCDAFWQVVGEVGCDVVFGCDAHDALSAYDEASLPKAMQIVKKYNLKYLEMPKINLLK